MPLNNGQSLLWASEVNKNIPKLQYKRKLSNISQPYMQKWKPNLITPLLYVPTSVRWKKSGSFQHPPQ